MSKLGIIMAEGCEEIESLAVVDVLRRAKMEIDMISITDENRVKGSHGIVIETDKQIAQVDFSQYEGVILPGGIPGTPNLAANQMVSDVIKEFAAKDKMVAAICAAPSILGANGLLQQKKATSYPGYQEEMKGCIYTEDKVVRDGNIITSRGMGTALDFALAILEYFKGHKAAAELAGKIMYLDF